MSNCVGLPFVEADLTGDRVSVVIQTDGMENASTRYLNGDLATKVKE